MKYLIHSVASLDLLTVVEAYSPEQAEQIMNTFKYQRFNVEEIQSISRVPEDYDLHEDALSKGYE